MDRETSRARGKPGLLIGHAKNASQSFDIGKYSETYLLASSRDRAGHMVLYRTIIAEMDG